MIRVETGVRVERPIEDVFTYVADPTNFPAWNSAVQAVRNTTAGGDNESASTYVLERNLPGGSAVNGLEVVGRERPTELAFRTTSGPTPFEYRFRFTRAGDATLVQIDMETDLGGGADLLAPLVRRAVQNGVEANLAELKALLEHQE
jgi:uncharacterized membrane protein